jgi:hypothetical protein
LDSESESEEESSEEETPRKKSTHQYKKRLIGDNNIIDSIFADIPEEYHDYIKQNHGKIYLKPDGIEYFNNPNYSYEQKIAMIDEISKLPKEIDKTFMNTLEEIQAYMSDDTRFEEIRKKKMEDMIKKQEEILNAKYNFAPRY